NATDDRALPQAAGDQVVGFGGVLVDETVTLDDETVAQVEGECGVAGSCPHQRCDGGGSFAARLQQQCADTTTLQIWRGGHPAQLQRRLVVMWAGNPCGD